MMKHRQCFWALLALLTAAVSGPGSAANAEASDTAAAEADAAVLAAGVPHERLFGVDFQGQRGIAVGDLGQLMWTDDGGATWRSEQAPTDLALLGVAMAGDRVIAVGQKGLMLVRESDGDWREVDSGTEERLLNVDVNAHGVAYAVGAFGTVLRSDDGGDSWRDAAPPWTDFVDAEGSGAFSTGAAGEPTMNAVQVLDDGTVFVGGEIAYIARSADGGENWSLVYESKVAAGEIQPAVNGLHVRPDGVGFAVGQAGLLLKTADGGRSWRRLSSPVEGNLHAVSSSSTGDVIAVGMRVAIRSADHGASWRAMDALDLTLNWYSDVAAASNGGTPIAVGHSARIIKLSK